MNELIQRAIQAAKDGDATTIESLVSTGAVDPNARDDDGYSLIVWAAQSGHPRTVEFLNKMGADINDHNNINQSTALQCAVCSGHLDVVKKLHELGADVNFVNKYDYTAIRFAIKFNRPDIAKFLIENFKDIKLDYIDIDDEYSLIHSAASKNMAETINLLKKHGLSIDIQDHNASTPLHYAAFANNIAALQELLSLNANANIRNKDMKQAIHIAIAQRSEEAIKLLSFYTKGIKPEDYAQDLALSTVFNNAKLNKQLQTRNMVFFGSGGNLSEFVNLVTPKLETFISQKHLDKDFKDFIDTVKNILNLSKLSNTDLLDTLKKQGILILSGGFNVHDAPTIIRKKATGEWQLTIIDRGAFAQAYTEIDNKTYPVRSITIPEDKLQEVIDTILQAEQSSENEATQLMFVTIPAIVNDHFSFDKNIIQKLFKQGQCFFENFKSLLLYEFVQRFGTQKGTLLYKEFDIYLHKQIFKEYQEHYQGNEKYDQSKIINLCNNMIETKEKHLSSSQLSADLWAKNKKVSPDNLEVDVNPSSLKRD